MNNEEKILELLSELSEGQKATNARLDKIESDLSTVKTDTEFAAHTIARLEIEHGKKLDLLMDNAYTAIEKGRTTEAAIVSLTDKVEKLEIEFDVLKNAK